MKDLQIVYKHEKPYGIRDRSGFLFFFTEISMFPYQKKRYERELKKQHALANFLLGALKAHGEIAMFLAKKEGLT